MTGCQRTLNKQDRQYQIIGTRLQKEKPSLLETIVMNKHKRNSIILNEAMEKLLFFSILISSAFFLY